MRLLNLLEKKGDLVNGFEIFQAVLKKEEEAIVLSLPPEQTETEKLVREQFLRKSHLTAFSQFLKGDIKGCMKTIYDYDNMRQKGKFEAAFKEILTHRKQLGLMSE